MTREDLKRIIEGITDEQLKTILDINTADIGKAKKEFEDLKDENNILKSEKEELNKKITELNDSVNSGEEYKKQLETLQKEIKEKEEAEKKAREDAELTSAIEAVFGDKKFTSDYVKNGIIADMKAEISKPENKGKGYAEIFESLTKDKNGNYLEGIFVNPNQAQNMAGMGNASPEISREEFSKMGYAQRNKLYRENPEMYKKLRSE